MDLAEVEPKNEIPFEDEEFGADITVELIT